jgi:hypothetical protein
MTQRILHLIGAWQYAIAAALYLALAGLALATDQLLWGDGALFAFVAGLDDPWGLFWHDFAARWGGGLISTLPAWLAGRLGVEAVGISLIYQATWYAAPLLGLGWAWRLLPAEEKDWIAPAVLFWAAVVMTTFTFPTELWLSTALFWPVLFALLFPTQSGARVTRLALVPLLMFTHETVVLLVPVLLFAAWKPWRPAVRRDQVLFSVVLLAAAVAMVAVALTVTPTNGLQVFAVAGNAGHFLTPIAFIFMPLLSGGAATLALFLIAGTLADRRTAENIAVAAGVLLALLCYAMLTGKVFPFGHYLARVGIAVLLPPFALVALLLRGRLRLERSAVLPFLAPLLAVQLVYQVAFNLDWQTFRAVMLTTLTDPPARPIIDLTDTPLTALVETPRQEANFLWRWDMPFQGLTLRLPPGVPRRVLITDQSNWFAPFTCAQAPRLNYRGSLGPGVMDALGWYICAANP